MKSTVHRIFDQGDTTLLEYKQEPKSPQFYLISNTCRVTNKVDKLQAFVKVSNANVAIITKSWLDGNILSPAITLGNTFNIYRKDRMCSQGGGVLGYVSEWIPTKQLSELEVDDKEVLNGCFIIHRRIY